MSYEIKPDTLVGCPFDKSHRIAAYKLTAHIIKCKKSHPELERLLEHCPFNAVHMFLPSEKQDHILNCIDRHRIFNRRPEPATCNVSLPNYEKRENLVKRTDDEDWDNNPLEDNIRPRPPQKPEPDLEQRRINVDRNENRARAVEGSDSDDDDTNRRAPWGGRGKALKDSASKKFRSSNQH